MKKSIVFEGDIHEDAESFKQLENVTNYWSALWDFAQWLRSEYKHGDREAVPTEELHTKFYEILSDNEVSLS